MIVEAPETQTTALGLNHPEEGPFHPVSESGWSGETSPLGAHVRDGIAHFAVYSKHATRILLEIFPGPIGEEPQCDYWMAKGPDQVWRAKVKSVPLGAHYGFRCWGPNWPFTPEWRRGNSRAGFLCDVDGAGHRFNPNKLLFDPYARELSHDRETPALIHVHGHNAGMYGTGPGLYSGAGNRFAPVPRREFDTGRWAPKAVLIRDDTPHGTKPRVPQKDAVIYETHLKGLTRHPSSSRLAESCRGIAGLESVANVPEQLRGTYAGAGCMAKYLKALGYTAVEFLPVHEFANDINPEGSPGWDRDVDEPPHGNYWGYMTYGFFAPDLRYAHDQSPGGPTREFKRMVKAFHDEGLEVYLDVVYNHTGEGGLWDAGGDTAELLFLRGFDNSEYYALSGDPRYYWDSTGCGNNLDASRDVVKHFIRDSLSYWAGEMGVDGFRFDLATVLGRTGPNRDFSGGTDLLRDIAATAQREGFEIMAEAWDLGGYNVGEFPPGWAEWNGRYRDALRGFLKGDGNTLGFIRALNGDYDHFQDQGGPHKSVNFITAHDGFTLMDLVSYNGKNNGMPWPFGPSDGGNDDNLSWDSGGDKALRRQRLRNFLAVQLFSRGVPLMVGGDEFARTQNGNNNPYKIDSIGIWQNYDMIASPAPHSVPTGGSGAYHDNYGRDANPSGKNGLFLFVHFLLRLRKAHPSLRQDRFGDFTMDGGGDVTHCFKREDGIADLLGHERCVHWRIDGSAVRDADFLLCINMHHQAVDFAIPAAHPGKRWLRLGDTAAWAEAHGNFWPPEKAEAMGSLYRVHPHSLLILRESSPPR